MPASATARRATRPVLALNAAPGEVDLVVASELLESTRAIGAGFVTPDRTVLIASSARVFTVDEKAAMGDGRLDQERMLGMAERFSRRAVIADFAAIAAQQKSPLNAVLLGAIAATGVLPIPAEAFRAAIRAEGKAVDANLRGFEAGSGVGAEGSDPCARPSSLKSRRESEGSDPRRPDSPPSLPKRMPSWPRASSASPTTRTAPTPGATSPASTGSSARPAPTARSSASSPATLPCA